MSILRTGLFTLIAVCVGFGLRGRATADTLTWDGGGGDVFFTTAANWVGDTPFTDGDSVIFFDPSNADATARLNGDATIDSINFNADADSNLSLLGANGVGGDFELTLLSGVTVDADSAANHSLDSRVTISNDITLTNDSGTAFTVNARIRDGSSAGGVNYTGSTALGRYVVNGGRNSNSSYTGNTTIENASVSVSTAFLNEPALTRGPLGRGEIVLGQPGSADFAELVVASGTDFIYNDLRVSPGEGGRTVRSGLGAVVRYRGALVGSGTLTIEDGTQVLENDDTNNPSTFQGRVVLEGGAMQVRRDGAFGDASTIVQVGDFAAMEDNRLRAFVENGGGPVEIVNPIDFQGGSIGGQGESGVSIYAATFSGDMSIATTEQVDVIAQLNATVVQDATLNFSGAISGGDAAAPVRFVAGALSGAADSLPIGSTALINLSGENTYDNPTLIEGQQFQLGDQLTVELSGSLANSQITITEDALLTGSGALEFNVSGADQDLITVDGALDITNLTLDLDLINPSETSYVIADFTNGSLVGTEFADVINLPGGASVGIVGTQIVLDGVTPGDLVGDYNSDGIVNAADYTIWRDTLGSDTDLRANGDDTGDSMGVIDAADYIAWRNNFGEMSGQGVGQVVLAPEPASATALVCLIVTVIPPRRRAISQRNQAAACEGRGQGLQ
ncbi:MAG: hypothetical protein AAGB00_01385 [Planctomycetota bacterium]